MNCVNCGDNSVCAELTDELDGGLVLKTYYCRTCLRVWNMERKKK